jgi:hypothetical protein
MTKELVINRLLAAGRGAVVFVALLALLVSGAFAAERAFTAKAPDDARSVAEHEVLGPTPGSAEPSDGMAGGDGPCTEPEAYIQALVILPYSNGQDKVPLPGEFLSPGNLLDHTPADEIACIGSTSEVSNLLGLRFTLVGAKPSGTS